MLRVAVRAISKSLGHLKRARLYYQSLHPSSFIHRTTATLTQPVLELRLSFLLALLLVPFPLPLGTATHHSRRPCFSLPRHCHRRLHIAAMSVTVTDYWCGNKELLRDMPYPT